MYEGSANYIRIWSHTPSLKAETVIPASPAHWSCHWPVDCCSFPLSSYSAPPLTSSSGLEVRTLLSYAPLIHSQLFFGTGRRRMSFKTYAHVSYSPDYFCESCGSHGSVDMGNQVIYHDNRGSRFLWNISAYLLDYTASHSRLHLSSWLYSFISFKHLFPSHSFPTVPSVHVRHTA